MNDIEKEEFIETINSVPMWVETKEDALKYAKHLFYRLLQSEAYCAEAMKMLSKMHPELHDHICEELIERRIESQYDEAYHSEK